jgi:hypothetical protein
LASEAKACGVPPRKEESMRNDQCFEFLEAVQIWSMIRCMPFDVRFIHGNGEFASTLAVRLHIQDSEGRFFTDVGRMVRNTKDKETPAAFEARVHGELDRAITKLRSERIEAVRTVERNRLAAVREAGRKRLEGLGA